MFCPVVTGNMQALQGAATPPGQPQPSPSQQGQFIFTGAVAQMPGQPQAAGPHQGQVTPGPNPQFQQAPLMYISNANVPTSAASAPVSYIPGVCHLFSCLDVQLLVAICIPIFHILCR